MGDFPHHFDAPEDAYFGFFRADSAKNAEAWAAVMSYPHVRIAAASKLIGMDTKTNSFYCATAEEYAASADWTSREATGWVRSEGRPPVRYHESADKVHLVGGWTRYNKDDQPILTNRVTYILTKPEDSWGIQARFSVQSFQGPDEVAANTAVDLVRQYIEAMKTTDGATRISLCRFPFVRIGIGSVEVINDAADMQALLRMAPERTITGSDVQAVQSSANGANIAASVTYDTGETENHLLLVGKWEESWSIAGASSMLDHE